jgi:hypothetical protein
MSTFEDLGSLLLVRGADELDHAGGTLYVHLHRVAKRLTTLGASDRLVIEGLAHAAYGTDGFQAHLFDWRTERPVLEAVIGPSTTPSPTGSPGRPRRSVPRTCATSST